MVFEDRSSPSGRLSRFTILRDIDPGSIAAGATVEVTVPLASLKTTDSIIVNPVAALTAGIGIVGARASASEVLAVTFANVTAGAIDPPLATYRVQVLRND